MHDNIHQSNQIVVDPSNCFLNFRYFTRGVKVLQPRQIQPCIKCMHIKNVLVNFTEFLVNIIP